MNLLQFPVEPGCVVLGWVLLAPALFFAWRDVRAKSPLHGAQQHLWLAGVVFMAWLWTLQVRTPEGAAFGLLGAALFALVFGRALALLGLLAAVVLHTLLAGGSWLNLGVNGVLLAVVPTALTGFLQRQLERRLPRNVFIFIIGNGMFVTLTVTAVTSVLLLGAGSFTSGSLPSALDPFVYALLLAWGEALASGMLFSALVIFGPHLVLTYRQDLYLPPRRAL